MRKNHVFGMGFFIFFTILWCTILSINVQPAQAATYTVTVNANGNGIGGTVSSTPATTGISYNYSGTPTSGSASFNSGTQVVLTAAVAYPDAMTAASCSSVNCSTASWGDTCANAGGTPGTAAGNGTTLATCTFASLDGNKTVAVTFEADIALVATPTCSSETKFYGTTEVDQLCTSAINGIVDGSGGPVPEFSNTTGNPDIPGDNADPNYFSAEWAAAGEAPAYITLTWTTPYVVDRIVLYDRPNSTDQVWTGIINFSDGSSVAVGNLSNDGAGVIFDSAHNADFTPSPKTITSLTFNITSAGGTNTGLAEIMVYGLPILTVTATPGSNGTLDPSTTSPASIVYGNTTAFKFNATTGYHVASITDTCGGSGYTNTSNSVSTYTYTTPAITAACTVSATFAINQYTLTYTPGAGGSISGSSPQTVNYGGSGTAVTAVPATGYHFVQWSDLSTTNPRTDTGVTANISVTASFAINTYTLTYTAGANGSISGTSPQTVNYGGSGTAVTAVPALGYHFVNWSDSSTANPRTDTNVTANITVTASFAINTYQVTAAAGANGSLDGTTPSPATVNYNATAAFKFNASANYHVATISDTCGGSGYTNSSNTVSTYTYTTPAITAACGVTAAFAINTFQVTAAAGSNGSLDGTTPSPATVNYNATAAFKFNANTNYHVATITDTCGGTGYTNTSNTVSTYTYTTPAITAACGVTAAFAINTFQVTAAVGTNGSLDGTTPSPATVNYNATAAFKFNGNTGYHVATITDTCGGSGYTNSSNTVSTYTYTTPAITAACGVTASFAINTFQVTAAAGTNGSLDGTTPSPATVHYNATAAFKFNASANYHVATITDTCGGSGYTNTSNSISTYTYTTPAITGACAVSATFGINQFQVTANADVTGNGTGSVSSSVGGISYSYPTTKTGTTTSLNYGTSVVLTATTGVGSAASWGNTCTTAGGAEAGDGTTSASCTFGSLDGNKTVTVAFGLNQYTVTANVDLSGDGIGSVSSSPGGINYNYPANSTGTTTLLSYGTKVVLTATATKTAKTGSTASWNGTCATAGGSETGNGTTSATCTFGQLNATATVTVTFTYDATITTPKTPTGPKTVTTGTAYKYATGGSSVKTGDPVEYQFDWGDGTDPSPYGSASQSKMWLSGSTYSVRARARSTLNHDLVSVWSGALVVSPTDKPFIHVTSPNGGETWVVGTTHPITWNSKYLGSTDTIYLYYWYAGKWYPITNSIDTPSIGPSTGTSSSYNWIIPDLPPTSPASGPTVPKSHMAWTAIYIGDMQTNGTWLCWDTNDKNFKILDNGWAFTISGADKGGATLFFNTDGSFDGYGISLKRGMFKIQGSYTVGANGSISGPYTLTDFESGDVLVSGNITTGTMNPNATTMTLTLKDSSSPPVAVFSMSGVWLSDLTMPENWSVQISGSAKGTISPSNPLKIETYKDLNNEPYANVFDVSGSGFLPDAITPISITGYFFFTPLKTVYGFFDQLTIGSNPEETGTISGTLNLSTGKFTFNLTTTSTNGNGHKYTFAGVKVVAP